MSILNAIFLGIVQGITEFLPVSSSGHLVLMREVLGINLAEQAVIFDIILHIGTLISVVVFYWKDVLELFRGIFGIIGDIFKGRFSYEKDPAKRFVLMLIIATIPLFVAVLFESKLEKAFTSPMFVGCALLVTGVIIFFTDKIKNGTTDQSNTKYKSALVVGLIQLFAVLPGISRSGSTIFAGAAVGMKKSFAIKFSLLLSIIAIVGAAVIKIPAIDTAGVSLTACITGIIVSAGTGILSIKFLVALLTKSKFKYIAYYCWAVGIFAIVSQLV